MISNFAFIHITLSAQRIRNDADANVPEEVGIVPFFQCTSPSFSNGYPVKILVTGTRRWQANR